jgi:hypothetical protein
LSNSPEEILLSSIKLELLRHHICIVLSLEKLVEVLGIVVANAGNHLIQRLKIGEVWNLDSNQLRVFLTHPLSVPVS